MTQYIDKSAVSAEINRRLEVLSKDRDFNYLQTKELNALLSSIDDLEVKEVDLEKEVDEYFDIHYNEFLYDDYLEFSKHFYELGLKAKGE